MPGLETYKSKDIQLFTDHDCFSRDDIVIQGHTG